MFPTFRSIITDIQTEISYIPTKSPVLIYIGVGTYAGLARLEENTNIRILTDDNYHQYPPFIKSLKNNVKKLNLFIILIDPIQENPPHMIIDKKLEENFRECEDPNKFKSQDNRITTYVLREPVTMCVYNKHHTDTNDITNDLEYLNRYCIENTVNLLYHDFSGRSVRYLAEYFDSQLNMYLDRIVYSINSREDTGCYFDLTQSNAHMAYRIKRNRGRVSLKFYNVFKYLQTKKYSKIESSIIKYDIKFQDIINKQKQLIIDNICSDFYNHSLATMRSVYKKIQGEDLDIRECHFNYIQNDIKQQILKILETHNYERIYQILFEYFGEKLDIIATLKKLDLNGSEILHIITSNPNPYLWISDMMTFLKS
jgi:hypothetical protein